jgi:hypothetical protein
MEELMNKLIENKKLQFNNIWANKITQEDISVPKQFDDIKNCLILNRIIYDSLLKLAKKINENFEKLIRDYTNGENIDIASEKLCYNIVLLTNALLFKMNSFLEIKIKQFKISDEMLESIKILQKYFMFFKNHINVQDICKRIEIFYNKLSDFIKSCE